MDMDALNSQTTRDASRGRKVEIIVRTHIWHIGNAWATDMAAGRGSPPPPIPNTVAHKASLYINLESDASLGS